MQENKMVETVFRFVTVRNPKKVSYSVEPPVDISVETSSDFQHQLQSASEEGDIMQRNERLLNVAKSFEEHAFNTLTALTDKLQPELLVFSEWLSVNKDKLTKGEIEVEIAKVGNVLEKELKEHLLDSLMYYSVIGQANSVTQAIIELLRADNFISQYSDKMTDSAIKKMAAAEVILPKSVFQLPNEVKAKEPEEVEHPVDVAKLNQEITLYTDAIAELRQHYTRQREIVKNTYEVDNRTGVVGTEENAEPNFNLLS